MSKRGNGEGTIYYSEKLNKWVGQFTAGRKANGKLNRKSVYGNTRKEVKEKMTKALAEVQTNTFIEKNDITLIELIDLQLNESLKANRIKETTYNRNIQTKRIIETLDIAYMPIQKITRANINNSLNELTNSTIEKVCILIRQAFNYAILNEIIQKDLFSIKGAVLRPVSKKQDKDINALDIEEQNAFLKELKKEYDIYNDVFYIALYTGMRIGEILTLTHNDIDFTNNQIIISKTLTKNKDDKYIIGDTTKTSAGKRIIPILSPLQPILQKYQNHKGLLFEINNKLILPSTINAHFKRICKNANIKVITIQKKKGVDSKGNDKYVNLKTSTVNTHMLRHTFATRCIESGINPVVLQKILGHRDIQVTLNTYTSVFDKYKEKEIQKVEQYFNAIFNATPKKKHKKRNKVLKLKRIYNR